MPITREAPTRRSASFYELLAIRNRPELKPYAKPAADAELDFVRLTGSFLMPDEGAREGQILPGFLKVRLDA